MMWNWLASALASGATLCLYDGSPFYPHRGVLFDYAEAERFSFLGTSAKYLDGLRKAGADPIRTHELSSLRSIASTGSPLAPEGFRYVYEHVKADVHLASISGGTDILSCFVLGIPTLPVHAGEIQGPGLGMAVDVWDDEGPCGIGRKGELRLHPGVSVDAARLLERCRRLALSGNLFRALRGRLVPRRFRRVDA